MRQKNKGSALAMVLVMLVFMSYISILIMSMSYSNLKISRSYNGDRRLYRGTDYVANLISLELQKKVKTIQDEARENIAINLNSASHIKATYEPYLVKEGALNRQDLDYVFNDEYRAKFKELFEASDYGQSEYTGQTKAMLLGEAYDEYNPNEFYTINTLNEGETIYYRITKAGYNKTTACVTCVIDTMFEFTNEIRSEYFQNKNTATLTFKINNTSEDFNVENYKIVNNKNPEIPIFAKNVALLSQKNIIFASGGDGKIDVTGDVIAFGHVPIVSSTDTTEREKSNWKDYGGILFGYSDKIGSHSTSDGGDTRTTIFGTNWNSNTYIPASSDRIAGNVTIDGNVATMGYVNVACNGNGRDIRITGDTFARQFILSEDSHQTDVFLGYDDDTKNKLLGRGNLYVTDDLQVDSSYSKLIVYGDFYGLSNKYTSVSGGTDTATDWTNEKRTSTLNINGNSIVELRNKVYIGGTTFLSNVRTESNSDENGNAGNPYITGISGAKSSQISAEAYIYSDKNDRIYIGSGDDDYIAIPSVSPTPYISQYYLLNKPLSMMKGYTISVDGNTQNHKDANFTQNDRAIHFKNYFDRNVSQNFGLMGTMNFGNLRVKTDSDGKVQGWAQGVIIAAGVNNFENILGTEKINAYYGEDYLENESKVFNNDTNPGRQRAIVQKYQSCMEAFLDNTNFGSGSNIKQTCVDTDLTNYIENVNQSNILNFIKNNPGTEYKNTSLGASVYYNKVNRVILSVESDKLKLTPSSGSAISLTYKKGIIFVDGDLYIQDNVNFEGIIIATGNITVTGSNVNIKRSKNISDLSNDIVNRLKEEDYSVKMFFGLQEYDIDYNNVVVQRINQDYVKLVGWKLA